MDSRIAIRIREAELHICLFLACGVVRLPRAPACRPTSHAAGVGSVCIGLVTIALSLHSKNILFTNTSWKKYILRIPSKCLRTVTRTRFFHLSWLCTFSFLTSPFSFQNFGRLPPARVAYSRMIKKLSKNSMIPLRRFSQYEERQGETCIRSRLDSAAGIETVSFHTHAVLQRHLASPSRS